MRDVYTDRQALALLGYVEVKIPGLIDKAEEVLRNHGMWPDEESTDA